MVIHVQLSERKALPSDLFAGRGLFRVVFTINHRHQNTQEGAATDSTVAPIVVNPWTTTALTTDAIGVGCLCLPPSSLSGSLSHLVLQKLNDVVQHPAPPSRRSDASKQVPEDVAEAVVWVDFRRQECVWKRIAERRHARK